MIFLYFFIAIIVIVGIYFAVELGVKYFEDKKFARSDKQAAASNIVLSASQDPVVLLEEINTTLEPIAQSDQVLIEEQSNLNREVLILRLLNVLNEVKTEKQIQQFHETLSAIMSTKYRRGLYGFQKKHGRTFLALCNYETETNDVNSGLSNLDVQLCTIEDLINAYSDQIIKSYRKKHKKEINLDTVKYSIVATRKPSIPKKT